MLISVVTAVYNRADTVGEAVESLRSQTWTGYEHVIQDDGSADGTLDVLGRLADERTRLVSGRDSGIYDALNRGLSRTTGEVMGLLHSDDLYAAPDILAAWPRPSRTRPWTPSMATSSTSRATIPRA